MRVEEGDAKMDNKCGHNIKERLAALNMSQADLCRKTGISTATMSQYVSGKYFPTQDRLEIIACALQTTPAYLMGWADYDPMEDAKYDQLMDLFKSLDEADQVMLIKQAQFLLSQKEK